MGTTTPAVSASEHEQTWVERFVNYGGGSIDAAKAAYRRTYPHGAPAPQDAPQVPQATEAHGAHVHRVQVQLLLDELLGAWRKRDDFGGRGGDCRQLYLREFANCQ